MNRMETRMNASPARPIRLYAYTRSGHAHRVELFLSLLGLPFEKIEVDLARGEQKKPEFLALNPFGQVPVIQDGEVTLADSNAILSYTSHAPGAACRCSPTRACGPGSRASRPC